MHSHELHFKNSQHKMQSGTLLSVKIPELIPIPLKFRITENEDVLSQYYRTIMQNK